VKSKTALLLKKAIEYNKGDFRRVCHLVRVFTFAELIANGEGLDEKSLDVLSAAAILHDIGIHECERKYKSTVGKYQEIEGPPVAEKIILDFDYSDFERERICWLIAHHHTYNNINAIDYQILVEADFL
jgi:HD superfamily phosphodiesterase